MPLPRFLAFLAQQIGDLRGRIQSETWLRQERKAFRNFRKTTGAKTWWESEDLPRIKDSLRDPANTAVEYVTMSLNSGVGITMMVKPFGRVLIFTS